MSAPPTIVWLACLWASLASASSDARISARNLLLTPDTPFELSAQPGCFKWIAADTSIVKVASVGGTAGCPSGSGSSSRLTTRSLHSGAAASATTMVLAVRLESDGSESNTDPAAGDGLGCEINVARVTSLSISTTTREMVAQDDEIQWLEVEAHDAEGNTFSPPALQALAFRWVWDGSADLDFVELEYTRQILDAHLSSLDNERARAYYRVAVHATTENPRVLVRVHQEHPPPGIQSQRCPPPVFSRRVPSPGIQSQMCPPP
eukprot:scaffold17004_cov67-Isochrysis_galbana.AAC.1